MVVDILWEIGLFGEWLEIEIIEWVIINSDNCFKKMFNDLWVLGCQLVFDDFGIGYVFFSMFKEFFIIWFKVDKSFVDVIYEFGEDYVVVQVMI